MAALADARSRVGAAAAGPDAEWCLPVLVADLAAQWAVEQDLAREGLDRDVVDAAQLAERSARLAAEAAAGLAVGEDVGPLRLPSSDSARAGLTAFVALYEAGLVDLVEAVWPRCPRCRDVLGDADLAGAEGQVDSFTVRVAVDDGPVLEAETTGPELLGAVVAVAVPPGHEVAGVTVAGRHAVVPLAGQRVPVVEDATVTEPLLLTPGHDAGHWQLARRAGLAAPVVEVEAGRFAAREAAVERLAAEGRVVGNRVRREEVVACAHCGTVAEARLEARWALDGCVVEEAAGAVLEEAAGSALVGAVTTGGPAGGPAGAGDTAAAPWSLGRDLWTGVPLPVGWCAECAKPTVGLAGTGSCGICLGELRPDPGFLDPLFVAAAWAAEVLRPDGGVLVGGSRAWLSGVLALARRLGPGPLTVVGDR